MNTTKKTIKVVSVHGGVAGGKTSLIAHLVEYLSNRGMYVLVMSETATEMRMRNFVPSDKVDPLAFQRELFDYQLYREEQCLRWARDHVRAEDIVILIDRGLPDGAAYVGREAFNAILTERNLTFEEVRDTRYSGYVYMVTAADGALDAFKAAYKDNPTRRESLEEVLELDRRCKELLIGSPHLSIIDNSTDFEGKIHRATAAVCRILGIPEPLEIEKKFEISDDLIWRHLVDEVGCIVTSYIEQTYIGETGKERVRARRPTAGSGFGKALYTHTIKTEVRPGVRVEHERMITEREYGELLSRKTPGTQTIAKRRHCFLWNNRHFELDEFMHPNIGHLLEIELASEDEEVKLPLALNESCLGEVTHDPRWQNANIARLPAAQ